MAEKGTCGTGERTGDFISIADCSVACRNNGVTMFVFGRDSRRCASNGSCQCWCQMSTTPGGSCVLKYHGFYNLYQHADAIGKSDIGE